MRLQLLRRRYLQELLNGLGDESQYEVYRSGKSFDLDIERIIPSSVQARGDAPLLQVDESTKESRAAGDADNAVRVHQWIGPLTPVQASDRRLWSWLTHGIYWTYTQQRWPLGGKPTDPNRNDTRDRFIEEHWFVYGGGRAGLRRNAISRLWLAAWLTVDPWKQDEGLGFLQREDRYHYTRVLLRRQQTYFDLVERKFGGSLALRICLLDALDKHCVDGVNEGELIKEVSKQVNMMGSWFEYAALDPRGVHERLCTLMEAQVKRLR